MAVQKKSKNKIGARCLSEAEVKQILPTYDQIKEQIEFLDKRQWFQKQRI